MSKIGRTFIIVMTTCVSLVGLAQQEAEEPIEKETSRPKVTAVYGITADDYLPVASTEVARKNLRPKMRSAASHPSFDLPDVFFFIGGPIFLLILLRVLVIFLNEFEEKRKEEMREAASERINPEPR